jgi:hypothetical protein
MKVSFQAHVWMGKCSENDKSWLQPRQHLCRMPPGLYLGVDPFDLAIRPNDKGCELDAHHFPAVHLLLFHTPYDLCCGFVIVGA